MTLPLKPRSRSVFQNYEKFEAWQQLPESSHCSLLQSLNKNLSSYENKYKKYMNIRQNQIKQMGKFQGYFDGEEKNNHQNGSFLPQIKIEHNFVRQSQNFSKPKVLVAQQNLIKDQQIFCERTNNNLKLKTISFDKNSKPRLPVERRKYSLNQNKPEQIQRFFYKHQIGSSHQKQNVEASPLYKMDTSNKMEGYKQLRYRLKKAANKSKLFHDEKTNKITHKELKENAPMKKVHEKRLTSIVRVIEDECLYTKTNQFSDKKFYEQSIREKYRIQR